MRKGGRMNFRRALHNQDAHNLQNELLWLFPAVARVSCSKSVLNIDAGGKKESRMIKTYQSVHKMQFSGTEASVAPELALLLG